MARHIMSYKMDTRRSRRLVRIAAALVLALAVLPNALYVGHWPFLPGYARSGTAAEAHEHAGHCHEGPGKCSEAPGNGAFVPIMDAIALLLLAGGVTALLEAPFLRCLSPLAFPLEKPPRRTWSSTTA